MFLLLASGECSRYSRSHNNVKKSITELCIVMFFLTLLCVGSTLFCRGLGEKVFTDVKTTKKKGDKPAKVSEETAVYFRCDSALAAELENARKELEARTGLRLSQSEVVRSLLRKGLDALAVPA